MGTRLTHIALHVDAMDECIKFYERHCNLKVADDQERGGRRIVLLAEPKLELEFVIQLIGGGEDRPAEPEKRATLDLPSIRERLWMMQLRRVERMELLPLSQKTHPFLLGTTVV